MDEFAITPEGEVASWQRRDPVWCPSCSEREVGDGLQTCVMCAIERANP